MKNKINFLVFLLVFAGVFASCKDKEQEPDDTPFEVPKEVSFTRDFVLEYRFFVFGDATQMESKVLIINSRAELENYITAPNLPAIDFSKYTLLLTGAPIPPYASRITEKLLQLSTFEYRLSIEVRSGNLPGNSQWFRALLVDKLDHRSAVELDLTVILAEVCYIVGIDEFEPVVHDESASIIGKWKLERVYFPPLPIASSTSRTYNYSTHNVVYEFMSNGILTISVETIDGPCRYPEGYMVGEHSYFISYEAEECKMCGQFYRWLKIGADNPYNDSFSISSERLEVFRFPCHGLNLTVSGLGSAYHFIRVL
jgi:hypothetical protein